MAEIFDQLERVSLSASGRPQLDAGESVVSTQFGVGLYNGDERLSECESGTLYLTSHSLLWVNSDSETANSGYAWRLSLERIAEFDNYAGFLRSHPKIVAKFYKRRDSDALMSISEQIPQGSDQAVVVPQASEVRWTCPICDESNAVDPKETLSTTSIIKCSNCGVRSRLLDVYFSCPVCTFKQKVVPPEVWSKDWITVSCSMCLTDWEAQYGFRVWKDDAKVQQQSSGIEARSLKEFGGPLFKVKYSFRSGGYQSFYNRLENTMEQKLWIQAASVVSSQGSDVGRRLPDSSSVTEGADFSKLKLGGVSGLMKSVDDKSKQTEDSLQDAFQDLDALMKRAQEMVNLAQAISAKMSRTSASETPATNEEADFKSMVMNLGIDDPVTRESAGDSYHVELGRQVSEFATPLLFKAGGMLSLTDLYCLYNRARGVSLISPADLGKACKQFDKLSLPVRLRTFDSGLTVVQSLDFNEAAALDRILSYAKSSGSLSAISFSELDNISILLATELLEVAERQAVVCRDETAEGLRFYPNMFKSF